MRLAVFLALTLALTSLAFLPGCGGSGDSGTGQPPTLELTADTPIVNSGGSLFLQWQATNANTVVSSNFGATAVTGSCTLLPQTSETYHLVVQGPGGTAEAEVPVQVFARDDIRGLWVTDTKRYEITSEYIRIYNINHMDDSLSLESQYPSHPGERLVYNDNNTITCEFYSSGGNIWIPSQRYGIGILGTLAVSTFYSSTHLWSSWQQLGAWKS
ncbi:MAG: hypothetical protein ACYDCO_01590 [Armatimonadota bacterium]